MATLPAPVVGKALEWLGKAAAAAAAAAGANEAIKDKPATKTREADCSEVSSDADCGQCLLINGRIGQPPTARYVTKRNRINYDYQLQIANLHAGPEVFGYVKRGDNSNTIVNIGLSVIKDFFGTGGKYTTLEWMYGGIAFDGFWRSSCTVVEAKGNYAKFFDEEGRYKYDFMRFAILNWKRSFDTQYVVVQTAKPQGRLEWHFMQRSSYIAAQQVGIPLTAARLTPYAFGLVL